MSSSTSSSERRLGPLLVRFALVLLLVLGGLEVVTRVVLFPRSRDFVRFAGYPQQAAELVGADGLRLAFIGNSATQRGLDPEQLIAELTKPARRPVHAGLFLADGSQINTWQYIVKQSFWQQDLNPDWFIVTFFGSGLEDGDPVEIGRLAQFFTGPADWPEVLTTDLPALSDRAEFLVSSAWATFAARDRIHKRVLATVVPDYKPFAEQLHAAEHRRPVAAATSRGRTCKALERFLTAAQVHDNRVCFVAFPTRDCAEQQPYPLNPEVETRIRNAGMVLLDLRQVPELRPEHFDDEYHLSPYGAKVYTHAFATALAPLVQSRERERAGQTKPLAHVRGCDQETQRIFLKTLKP